jgi:integrase/recombinase XerD
MLKSVPTPQLIRLTPNQAAPKPNIPLDLADDRIQEFLQAKNLRPNSQRSYRQNLTAFKTWANIGFAAITPRKVAAYKAYLEQECKKAPSTVAAAIASLRSFYQWMLLSGYVSVDPTIAISCPTPPEALIKAVLPTQFRSILTAAYQGKNPERDLALLWLLAHGLRASEASALDVCHFDGERVFIHQAKQNSIGTVPISTEAAQWIQLYLGDRATGPLLLGESNRNRDRLSYEGIKQICQRLSKAANVKFTAHSLRHTFGTQLMLKGLSAFDVQTLLRHRSPASTRRYTIAVNQRVAEENFRKLGTWLDE